MKLPYETKIRGAIDEFALKQDASPEFKAHVEYLLDYLEIVAEPNLVSALVEKLPSWCCTCEHYFFGDEMRCSTQEIVEVKQRMEETGKLPSSLNGYCLDCCNKVLGESAREH